MLNDAATLQAMHSEVLLSACEHHRMYGHKLRVGQSLHVDSQCNQEFSNDEMRAVTVCIIRKRKKFFKSQHDYLL